MRSNANFHTAEPTGAGCSEEEAPAQDGDGTHLAWSRPRPPDCCRHRVQHPPHNRDFNLNA